jgi:branched-chain amino acid transport system permease protein
MTGSSSEARLITPTMLGAWLVLATVPLWINAIGLYPYIGVEIVIWSIYALAFNLVLGTSGLPSFGHGAFFVAGAILAGAFAGLIVGLLIAHRRGIYFALMTIAFGQIFWTISVKWHSVTGGEDGLLNILRLPATFGVVSFDISDNETLYYFVLAVFAVVVMLLWRLVNSPYGRILSAIRQSETRTAHLGYNVWLYKLSVIVISAGLSGFAGGLFAMAQRSAFPDVMNLAQSGLIVMMTLVGGGLVSFWGPVVGVIIFLIARDVIGAMTNAWALYFGAMFVLLVLFRPEGIAGGAKLLMERWKARREASHVLSSAPRSG